MSARGGWLRASRGPVLALALAGLSTATALGEGALRSNLATMVQSAADLIAQRSPGERRAVLLGKGKYAKFGKDVRMARALPRVRDARPFVPEAPAETSAPIGDGEAPEQAAPVAVASAPVFGGAVRGPDDGFFLFTPVPGPGLIGGGPAGGIIIGGPGGGGGVTPPPGPPVPTPVPEPASWSMMLLGFGALGVILRRQRHVRPVLL